MAFSQSMLRAATSGRDSQSGVLLSGAGGVVSSVILISWKRNHRLHRFHRLRKVILKICEICEICGFLFLHHGFGVVCGAGVVTTAASVAVGV